MYRRSCFNLMAATLLLAACGGSDEPVVIVTDAQLKSDVAEAVGNSLSHDFNELKFNETFAGLQSPATFTPATPGVTIVRTRTCWANNVSQGTACDPTTTDSVVITMAVNGSFSRTVATPDGNETVSTALHRSRSMTIRGLFGAEQFRNHNGGGVSSDTISFSGTTNGAARARVMTVAALDSVDNIVFHLPHSSNPWPLSGSLIRYVTGKVAVTGGPNPGERLFATRVEVSFPADAQGNVELDVDGSICNLNLATRVVSNCT